MLRYRRYLIRLLKRSLLIESTRTKHCQDSYMLFDSHADSTVAEQSPSHVSSYWFATGSPFYDSHPLKLTNETIWEGKSFDDFGHLSSWNVNLTSAELLACTTPFVDRLMSCDSPSGVTISAIPTTVDPSELGGLTECGNMDQHELFDQRYYQSPVLHEDTTSRVQKSSAASERPKCVDSMSSLPVSYERSRIQYPVDTSQPSLPEVSYIKRFDPDINRTCRSTAEEIIAVVRNQDLSLLRSILTEKKWPNHRSIGAHLDDIFELVVRDSHDTDEAVLFFRDFAVCNRRGFLHDSNGIRLASRIARDSGSLQATMEILRAFRNMFLVRSPDTTKFSTPEWIMEDFYKTVCSIGLRSEIEELHKLVLSHGFDKNSNVFIRVFTNHSLVNNDFITVFNNWKELSSRYGTTSASGLIWKGIFTKISDRRKQVDLAGELLEHCRQYDHPSAIIANILIVLIRLNQIDAARSIFTKVSIPGRFFKKPIQCIDRNEDMLKLIECFASLITECMFAEKRRCRSSETPVQSSSSFLSTELLSKLNSFYGVGSQRRRKKFSHKEEKPKLHRIDDEQLFELCEFVQFMWMEGAELSSDLQAIDRLVSWSIKNRLEVPPRVNERIVKMKCAAQSGNAVID